ncbi:hypothetical protein [Kineosporia babensis]|uniref:Uncharacterized protein n=1 Tax=Kineosporia babensis TaxID=499548 RepID=A0A9X1NC19_9ACTN|nr:hypothetical protein [Kineosporia babensis]MCD5310935.1 hypothetical protein [Kineosporia babensis]
MVANEGRHPKEHGVTSEYLALVDEGVFSLLAVAAEHCVKPQFAVEGVSTPRGHAKGGFVKPRDLAGLGIVFGWVLGAYPDAVVVAPDSHGQGLLRSYPDALVTAAERRGGLDRPAGSSALLRHARSSWDVTLNAEKQARWQVAS